MEVSQHLPASEQRRLPLHWINISFFTLTPLAAVALTWFYLAHYGWSWSLPLTVLLSSAVTCLSITAGYHRLITHRSYQTKKWVKVLFLIVGAAAFQGPALQWGTDHRRHHRFTDKKGDPHNINQGFWHAHLGWLFHRESPELNGQYPHDLRNDPWIQWQNRYYVPLAIGMGFVLPLAVGWLFGNALGGLVFGGAVRVVVSNHVTFLINSLAHTWGKRPYSDTQTARDSLLMAVLAYGEGYHNFHHQFQADYRNGIRWYHWDPTKWLIDLMSALGWAWGLKAVPQTEILKARLRTEQARLLRTGAPADRVYALKQRVEEAQRRWRTLREDYVRLRRNVQVQSRASLLHLKAELKVARLEFKMSWAQWGAFRRTLRALPTR